MFSHLTFDQLILAFIKIAIPAFLMIVFIQSGLDKIIDKKGNLDWLRDHFSKTFLKSIVPHLLLVLTLLEFISGILFFVGILFYFFKAQTQLIVFGLILSNITILCLFLGQRIAKDYVGAADLVNYFTLSIIGLLVFLY